MAKDNFMKYKWEKVKEYQDIIYEKWEGIARITINRPEVRNAFRPETVNEMHEAFDMAREDPEVGVVLLTGKNPAFYPIRHASSFKSISYTPV